MNRLILHVGTHKTGTTSIQETLYYGLSDPRFQYVGFGQVNGSRGMATVFGDSPSRFRLHALMGLGASEVERLRTRLERRLAGSLDKARRRGATPIISAEWCCLMNRGETARVRRYFEERGFRTSVIVYLRPLQSYYASAFQEYVKYGGDRFVPFDSFPEVGVDRHHADYAATLELLDQAFGRDSVMVVPFDRRTLHGACAVQDFCRRVGISLLPRDVRLANETLSVHATKLLYTLYSQGSGYGAGPGVIEKNLMLKRALERLDGPPFKFHPALVGRRSDEIRRQHAAAADRMGVAFPLETPSSDDDSAIRDECDLRRHAPEALRWLALVSGLEGSPPDGSGDASDWVVERMERIRENPALGIRIRRKRELVRRELRRVLHGV